MVILEVALGCRLKYTISLKENFNHSFSTIVWKNTDVQATTWELLSWSCFDRALCFLRQIIRLLGKQGNSASSATKVENSSTVALLAVTVLLMKVAFHSPSKRAVLFHL